MDPLLRGTLSELRVEDFCDYATALNETVTCEWDTR